MGTADLRRVAGAGRRRWRSWRKQHGPEVLHVFTLPTADGQAAPSDGRSLAELDETLLDDLRSRYPREVAERRYGILRSRIGAEEQTCWVILREGVPAGYCHAVWTDTVNERIHHPVPVAPDQVYLFDTYVMKAHRRQGLHSYALQRRLELARERGRREAMTIITSSNAASRATFLAAGATRSGTLVFLPPLRRTVRLPRWP